MGRLYPDSHVEVSGFMARHYDAIMDIATLGAYRPFIRDAMAKVAERAGRRILVLGAGGGRNTCLLRERLGDGATIQAFDIGDDMIERFEKRCGRYANVALEKRRIDAPLEVAEPYDAALISFVLHGLPQDARLRTVSAAREALREGGTFFVLDYDPALLRSSALVRRAFNAIECPYAWDYLEQGWPGALADHGFEPEVVGRWFRGKVSLVAARKRG